MTLNVLGAEGVVTGTVSLPTTTTQTPGEITVFTTSVTADYLAEIAYVVQWEHEWSITSPYNNPSYFGVLVKDPTSAKVADGGIGYLSVGAGWHLGSAAVSGKSSFSGAVAPNGGTTGAINAGQFSGFLTIGPNTTFKLPWFSRVTIAANTTVNTHLLRYQIQYHVRYVKNP